MTKHPNDEFDRVPEFTNRKGVHRQAMATAAAKRRSPLGWIVAFGILALVVGLFSFFVLPQLTGEPAATVAAASSSASTTPSASDAADATSSGTSSATDAASEKAGASESAAAASSKAAAAAAAEAAAAKKSKEAAASSKAAAAASSSKANAAPDLSTKVGVFNGSRRSGLAASAKNTLSGAGFTNTSAANWTKKVNTSIVYYASDADKATAQKAAGALGINALYQTSQIPGKIAVVLGSNF